MALSTFPTPNNDNKFLFPNTFGVSDNIFNAIVRQAGTQIDEAVAGITTTISGSAQLTDETNIATDASLGVNFYVTLTDNRNMSAPTNPSDWQIIRYYVTQDSGGSRTLSWNAVFRFSTGIPSPTLTTTAYFSDYIEFIYNPTYAVWDCLRVVKGFDSTPL